MSNNTRDVSYFDNRHVTVRQRVEKLALQKRKNDLTVVVMPTWYTDPSDYDDMFTIQEWIDRASYPLEDLENHISLKNEMDREFRYKKDGQSYIMLCYREPKQ